MTTYQDLQRFFKEQGYRLIMVADAETRIDEQHDSKIVTTIPAGGVSVALDPIAKAANATYIGRARNQSEKAEPRIKVESKRGAYVLKRIFLSDEEMENYYYGFSNQTLWPLCHVTFERPEFKNEWFEGYKKVNQKFAEAIKKEIKGKTLIWINDYQLSLVPSLLGKRKDVVIAMFWHIPWPTWEAFRILPQRKEILQSLLNCDFLGFHRGYQARNFLDTVERELEVRTDDETNQIYFNKQVTTVKNLPMGIDADVIASLIEPKKEEGLATKLGTMLRGHRNDSSLDSLFKKYKVILGVDRLDYTKGLIVRLKGYEVFLKKNPRYHGKVMYLGIIAPSRERISAYAGLKQQIEEYAVELNKKYGKRGWQPVHIIEKTFSRKEVIAMYMRAALCLVTPRDDGMNLVSKEFVLATSFSRNPGMLVLSRFAGSAIDLTQALIINPYDEDEISVAIKRGLEMDIDEKKKRINAMVKVLQTNNVYEWARNFVEDALASKQ